MARIPMFSPDNMTPEQETVYRSVINGPRGVLVGPLRVALHRPDLAARWSAFGEMLRFGTTLPARLSELAIVVTARRWNSQIEWHVHAAAAARAGVPESALQAIRNGEAPSFDEPDDADVYEFARTLQQNGNVPEALYQRVLARWGNVGIVELTAVIGYYTLVSMTLNVHEIPLPDAVAAPLAALQQAQSAPAAPQEQDLPRLTALPPASARPA